MALALYAMLSLGPATPYNAHVRLAEAWLDGLVTPATLPPHIEHVPGRNGAIIPYGPGPSLLLLPFVALWGLDTDQSAFCMALGALNAALMWSLAGRLGAKRNLRTALTVLFTLGSPHLFYAVQSGNTWPMMHLVTIFGLLVALRAAFSPQSLKSGLTIGLGLGLAFLTRQPAALAVPFVAAMSLFNGPKGPTSGLSGAEGAMSLFNGPKGPTSGLSGAEGAMSLFNGPKGPTSGLSGAEGAMSLLNGPKGPTLGRHSRASGSDAPSASLRSGLHSAVRALPWKLLGSLALGFGACLALSFAYNWARMGNPLDTGYERVIMAITPAHLIPHGVFSAEYLLRNLHAYVLSGPERIASFPYVRPSQFQMSMLLVFPALLLIPLADWRNRINWLAMGAIAAMMTVYLFYYWTGATQFGMRYAMDGLPLAMVLIASAGNGKSPLIWLVAILGMAVEAWGLIMWRLLGWA